jgi:hypothetical protein
MIPALEAVELTRTTLAPPSAMVLLATRVAGLHRPALRDSGQLQA